MSDLELAKAIYERHRQSDLARKRKQGTRIPTWDELPLATRRRLVAHAKACSAQYYRSRAREVPLIP